MGGIKARDFDDLLEAVGTFGRCQKMSIAFFLLPISFIFGFACVSYVFEMVVPDHWCHVPGRENTTLTQEQWKHLTIPRKEGSPGKYESCQMYDGVWDVINGSSTYTVTNNTIECAHGWDFDRTDFSETVPSEFEWVCSYGNFAPNSQSIIVVGRALGTLLLPLLADNFIGRRRAFFLAVSTYAIFTVPLLWIRNAPLRFLFRFLQGIGYETNYIMPCTIIIEVIPPSHRALVLMLTFVTWTSGTCFTAVVAWLVEDWKILSIITAVPFVAILGYWRFLPESPRWLLSKGRLGECADILEKIGAANGVTKVSREKLEEELKDLTLRLPPNEPLTKVFVYPKLRLRAAMLYLLAFTQFIAGGCILLSISVIPGNIFVSHLILTAFEIPSVFVGLAVTHYFGRRFLGYSSLLVSAVCAIIAPFCVHNEWLLLGVLAVAKLACTSTIYLVFLLPAEILPTPIRSSGAGMTVVAGLLGMTLSPQIIHAGLSEGAYYGILLSIHLLSMAVFFPLPETLGLLVPQTFKDGEELGNGRPLTSWVHHWNLHKYPAAPAEDAGEEKDLVNGVGSH